MFLTGILVLAALVLSVASLVLFLLTPVPAVFTLASLFLCVLSSYLFLYLVCRVRSPEEELIKDIFRIGTEAREEMDRISKEFMAEQQRHSKRR